MREIEAELQRLRGLVESERRESHRLRRELQRAKFDNNTMKKRLGSTKSSLTKEKIENDRLGKIIDALGGMGWDAD